MKDISPEAYKAALKREREGYAAAGKTDRVKQVDAALKASGQPSTTAGRGRSDKGEPETTAQRTDAPE